MLGEISFVIIREIIKRIVECESIDNLIKINKKFRNLIINDRVCQEHYLKIKYNLIMDKNDLEAIRFLNSKSYSKYIGKGFVINNHFNIFVRPKDDKFVITHNRIYNRGITNRSLIRVFKFSDESIFRIILFSINKNVENFEHILKSNGFFYLHIDNKKEFMNLPLSIFARYERLFNEIGKANIKTEQYFDNFDHRILEIFNKLKN